MARIVSKSRAGGNGAKPTVLAGYRTLIITPFGGEGKPRSCPEIAHIQQFRVYVLDRSAGIILFPAPAARPGLRFGEPDAIVVLVKRGAAMIATRPDKGISTPHERIQT
jgi:hypothetical protein